MSERQPALTSSKAEVPWWIVLCQHLWKLSAFLGTAVVLALAVNVGSTWLTSPGGKIPNDAPLSAMMQDWPLVLLVAMCLLLLAALFWAISHWKRPTTLSMTPQDRARMLGRLRVRYEQMLTQTLQDAVRLDLGLASRPAAIQSAASLALRLPALPDQFLPPQTSIADVYEQAGQELLILGEPGAGKSTLLLELAHHLLRQAEQHETQPLPLVVPLSSWANRCLPLQTWLIEQVALLYDVPPQLSRQWVEAEQVLPLLDGLDEMDEAARPACIAAINSYHRAHLHPLIVCSRTDEYERATAHERLALHTAVVVQPLSVEQVDRYLAPLGKPLAALRRTLKKHEALAALATTPLMVQILILTFHGTPMGQLSQQEAILLQQIWKAYVKRMVERKGDVNRYPLDHSVCWLSWLARRMREHNQTIFTLEGLQPDLLPKGYAKRYQWSAALLIGVISGLLTGLSVGLLTGLSIGLRFGLLFGPSVGLRFGLLDGLLAGLLSGPLSGLPYGLFVGLRRQIEPAERVSLSWKTFRNGLLAGLLLGLLDGPSVGLLLGLLVGLLAGPLAGLILGLKLEQLGQYGMLTPNEGLRRSLRHGLSLLMVSGPVFGLVGGLFGGLRGGLLDGLFFGLPDGLGGGLVFGLIFGLFFGLGAVVQHYTLRFWLARLGCFPYNAVPFLEDATKRILLQRVGGGYRFTHRLLLDYLADLDTIEPSTSSDHQSAPKPSAPGTP